MKKPMTTKELFEKICSILEGKRLVPDILDYSLASSDPVLIQTCEFELKSSLAYGGSEGIYLTLWIEFFQDGKRCINGLGTFKTLLEDRNAMHRMSGLLADFIVEEDAYVNENPDDFTWEGVNVHPLDASGKKSGWGYSYRSMETALEKKDILLKEFPYVLVRDNRTRKEERFRRGGVS